MGFGVVGMTLLTFIAIVIETTVWRQTNDAMEAAERQQARAVFEELVNFSRAASQCLAGPSSPVSFTTPGQSATLTVDQIATCGTLGPGYSQTTGLGTAVTIQAVETTTGVPRVTISVPIPAYWMPAMQWVAPEFNVAAAGITLEAQSTTMAYEANGTAPAANTLTIDSNGTTPGHENAAAGFGQ